jgi:hypothetical protein
LVKLSQHKDKLLIPNFIFEGLKSSNSEVSTRDLATSMNKYNDSLKKIRKLHDDLSKLEKFDTLNILNSKSAWEFSVSGAVNSYNNAKQSILEKREILSFDSISFPDNASSTMSGEFKLKEFMLVVKKDNTYMYNDGVINIETFLPEKVTWHWVERLVTYGLGRSKHPVREIKSTIHFEISDLDESDQLSVSIPVLPAV